MLRWLFALIIASILSGMTVLLVTGRYFKDGPVVLQVSQTHGLHLGDLFILGGWLVGLLALAGLMAFPRARGSRAGIGGSDN